MHPIFCPEEKCIAHKIQSCSDDVNTALIDSSGRKISLHVKCTTAATLSLMGAKYHPQRRKVLPN